LRGYFISIFIFICKFLVGEPVDRGEGLGERGEAEAWIGPGGEQLEAILVVASAVEDLRLRRGSREPPPG